MAAAPDKVMIVTGAGRGIGAQTARLAAKAGYAVCINYVRDRASAETLKAEIERPRERPSPCAATSRSSPTC